MQIKRILTIVSTFNEDSLEVPQTYNSHIYQKVYLRQVGDAQQKADGVQYVGFPTTI